MIRAGSVWYEPQAPNPRIVPYEQRVSNVPDVLIKWEQVQIVIHSLDRQPVRLLKLKSQHIENKVNDLETILAVELR